MAFPETAWGFFPDCGATFVLSKLEANLGMFLGLTGFPIRGYDLIKFGLSSYYGSASWFHNSVRNQQNFYGRFPMQQMLDLISMGGTMNEADITEPEFDQYLDVIDKCFGKNSVEEIMEALQVEGTDWSLAVLEELKEKSPLSLKVTFEAIRRARKLDLLQTLEQDYTLSRHFIRSEDFYKAIEFRLLEEIQSHDQINDFQFPTEDLLHINPNDSLSSKKTFRIRSMGKDGIPPWSQKIDQISSSHVTKHFQLPKGEQPVQIKMKSFHASLQARSIN